MKLLLVIVLIVVVVGVIYFRAVAPWMAARCKRKKNKRKKNRKNIRDMHSYIKSTGEFDFSRLMNNAGEPLVLSYRSPGIFRLPEKKGYLKMVYSRDGALLDELYVLKPPFFRKKIWEKAEEYYFCFFYISGSSIGVKARKLYLNYDAICAIYNEVRKS